MLQKDCPKSAIERWNRDIYRSSHQRCSIKKVFLKILQLYRKTPVLELIFNFIKLFKNTYFEEHLRTAAFVSKGILQNTSVNFVLARQLLWRNGKKLNLIVDAYSKKCEKVTCSQLKSQESIKWLKLKKETIYQCSDCAKLNLLKA